MLSWAQGGWLEDSLSKDKEELCPSVSHLSLLALLRVSFALLPQSTELLHLPDTEKGSGGALWAAEEVRSAHMELNSSAGGRNKQVEQQVNVDRTWGRGRAQGRRVTEEQMWPSRVLQQVAFQRIPGSRQDLPGKGMGRFLGEGQDMPCWVAQAQGKKDRWKVKCLMWIESWRGGVRGPLSTAVGARLPADLPRDMSCTLHPAQEAEAGESEFEPQPGKLATY